MNQNGMLEREREDRRDEVANGGEQVCAYLRVLDF